MQSDFESVFERKFHSYINCIEGGNSFPPPAVIDQIAQVLGIDPGQLFQKDSSPESLCHNGSQRFSQEITDRIMSHLKEVIAQEVSRSLSP